MLKNIPEIIPSDLMKILMDMGHGDEIVIGDANFPAVEMGRRVVNTKGHGVPEVLEAMLKFFPLDTFVEKPIALMQTGPQFKEEPTIWDDFKKVINKSDEKNNFKEFDYIDRFEFYERAKKSFAIVGTSETSLYACIIIKKGVL
jgi:L-fucose mutarotase